MQNASMTDIEHIIDAIGLETLADQCGVSVHTVKSWRYRKSIPSEYWIKIGQLSAVSPEELAKQRAHAKGLL
jgi:hypothetical protein